MDICKLDLKEPSKIMDEYINHFARLTSFFAYDYHDDNAYKERLTHLKERNFDRESLVQYLLDYNQKYQPHKKVIENIKRLGSEEAVAVVAGQQAGLLTGPAYTIHKCLSILKLAKEKEEELGVPVIPIFWVAGEDHDFEEANHINILDGDRTRKHKLKILGAGEDSVSHLPMDQEKLVQWVKTAFRAYGETEYTESLLEDVIAKAKYSYTMVDFFSAIIHEYFGQYGLVLLDSGDKRLRKVESKYFVKIVEKNESIAQMVTNQLTRLKEQGFNVALDQKPTSANLFYHENGERILLERADKDMFINSAKGIQLTRKELLDIAHHAPEKLSNNVVTRPLMQESLLPTLAFIGGPGEVAYWSALKGAFEVMGMLMPPVLPRIRITMLDQKTKKWLDAKGLTVNDALKGDWTLLKAEWLKGQHEWDVDGVYSRVLADVEDGLQPIYKLATEVNPNFDSMTIKNKKYINDQLGYIKKAIERELKNRFEVELRKFDRVKAALCPDDHPQERTWSIYYFLNYWGPDLIRHLMEDGAYSFDGHPLLVEI